MRTPKPTRALLAALVALGGLATLSNAQSVTTTPVGAVSTQIPGASGTPSMQFLGFPLLNPNGAVAQVGAVSTTEVTLTTSALSGVTLSGPHYILITSGANVGLTLDIASYTANTLTLTESAAGLLSATNSISIRPHRTLANTFGATNQAGLLGSTTSTNADEIRVFNPTTQSFVTYYYKTGGLGGTGWRSTASTSADRASDIIYPEQAIILIRKSAESLNLVSIGEVYADAYKLPVETGTNWIINTSAKDTTLANLGYYTGDASGITGATTIASADEILRWTGSSWERFYYKTGGLGGAGWRSSASTSVDRGAQAIGAGEVLVISRKSSSLLVNRPSYSIN